MRSPGFPPQATGQQNKGGTYDSVAQLVEQYTFNVWVLGSNPSGITKNKKPLVKEAFCVINLLVPLSCFPSSWSAGLDAKAKLFSVKPPRIPIKIMHQQQARPAPGLLVLGAAICPWPVISGGRPGPRLGCRRLKNKMLKSCLRHSSGPPSLRLRSSVWKAKKRQDPREIHEVAACHTG